MTLGEGLPSGGSLRSSNKRDDGGEFWGTGMRQLSASEQDRLLGRELVLRWSKRWPRIVKDCGSDGEM